MEQDLIKIDTELRINHYGVNGLLCQLDKDEGDTLQRTSTYYLLTRYLLGETPGTSYRGRSPIEAGFSSDLAHLRHKDHYARSSDTTKWYGDMEYTSRDQLAIAMAACAACGIRSHLFKMFGFLVRNWGFHANIYRNGIPKSEQTPKIPDVISPEEIAAVVRGLPKVYGYLLYPFLLFLDLSMLFMVVWGRNFKPWDADNMLLSHLVLADMKLPTPISWVAKKIYGTKRLDVLSKLRAYHHPDNNGIPPLYKLQELAFNKLTN